MKLFKVTKSAVLLASLYSAMSIGITLPAPPPELPDTLTKFRTLEQLNEDRTQDNSAYVPFTENVEIESAPFVPGDDSTGIVRIASIYTPEATVGVPDYGGAIVRFYDLEGIPWNIASVRCENQGFSAEVTASPSELLIKQGLGAVSTKMAVSLENYDTPLVFTLSPVKLERNGTPINTVIYAVRIKSYTNTQGYVFPNVHEVPKPNPQAQVAKFDGINLSEVENNLVEAVRAIKQEETE